MLHPDLQQLLDFALESGEVTDKHRQILHNKAVAINENIDELDMIIDGEIKRFKKRQEGEKQTNYSCPNCGFSIPRSSIKCSYCGFEVSKSHATGENFIQKLNQQIEEVNKRHAEAELKNKWGLNTSAASSAAQQKASIISTFTMPSDKEHLLEFFFFCHGNYEGNYKGGFIFFGAERMIQQNINIVAKAYQGKAKTAYEKLKRFVNEDEDIKNVVVQFKGKYDI